MSEILERINRVGIGQKKLRTLSTPFKNEVLLRLASQVDSKRSEILSANQRDLAALSGERSNPAFKDRLALTSERIDSMVTSLKQVVSLPDPVGEVTKESVLKSGLNAQKIRAPLGVVFVIFESRPNVAIDAFSLCFKSGNAVLLKGGKEANFTLKVLYQCVSNALGPNLADVFLGLPSDISRDEVKKILSLKDKVDLVIPRGGDALIEFVSEHSKIPIIKNDRGMCHVFVDKDADLEMALKIIENAKTSRPGVCNAAETLLVDQACAGKFLPKLFESLSKKGVEFYLCAESFNLAAGVNAKIFLASQGAWDTEYLDLKLNVKIVPSLDAALLHIESHGSRHSEAIVTQSNESAERFLSEVDAAATYWNASTRFTDGFEMGLGSEIGISTQKLHVRGPVGLSELTSERWVLRGNGEIR